MRWSYISTDSSRYYVLLFFTTKKTRLIMLVQSKIAGQRGREVHPYLRIVVVTLCLFHTEDWHEISRKTSVEYDTAYKIWRRTTTRADTEFDLIEILSHIGTQDRSGRPVAVTDGTPESEQIRRLLLDNTYSTFT